MTNTLADAVAGFFTDDPGEFEDQQFVRYIRRGEQPALVGQAAIRFLTEEAEQFCDRQDDDEDPWCLTDLLVEVVKAFPAELLPALGAKLTHVFTEHLRRQG